MSKITYKANLIIFIHNSDKENSERKVEILNLPVHSFEVAGGAIGKIDVTSSDEQMIICQFEQARNYKNIIFYMKQGKDIPLNKLIGLSKSYKNSYNGENSFTVSFGVSVIKGEMIMRRVSLQSTGKFSETPIPVGKAPPLLKMKLSFESPKLYKSASGQKTERFTI